MPQTLAEKSPLSIHRAFVVHVRADADVALGQMSGRVEHVLSGHGIHFASVDDLLAFIAQNTTHGRKRKANNG